MSDTALPNETCPRCGGAFLCGADTAGGCACFGLQLSPALLEQLREQYSRCLCLNCLTAMQRQEGAPERR